MAHLRRVVATCLLALAAVSLVLLASPTSPADAQDEPWVITSDGLGPVRIGASLDEVRAQLPEGYVLGDQVPIAPDFDGFVISVDGAVHALIPVSDNGVVPSVIVLSDEYRTADGIGPGSLVGDAEDVYGDATLSWSADDEGRERVVYENQPSGLSFRTSEAVGPQAGIYGNGTTTVLYEPDSRLTSVWILPTDDAPAADEDPTAEEAADEEPAPEEEPAAEESAEDEPAEDEPAEDEPAEDEPAAEDEPEQEAPAAEDDLVEDAAPADDGSGDEELPETGADSSTIAAGALTLVFLGFAVARTGNKLRPWS